MTPLEMNLLLGFVAAVFGAALSGVALVWQDCRARKLAKREAIGTLALELKQVMEIGDKPKPRTEGGEPFAVAFVPMPNDAYRLAFPYVSVLPDETKSKVLDCGKAVATYNASAEYVNGREYHEERHARVILLAADAEEAARLARKQLALEDDATDALKAEVKDEG